MRTRYCLGMARTRRTQDKDVISRLADAGEDALRRLVEVPRRTVAGAMDAVGERLQDGARKLRAADPLARRVAALEKRLDSLEKPKRTARRASTRAKPSAARRASTAAAPVEPEQAEHDRGRREDDQA
jgi:hypothetical protein